MVGAAERPLCPRGAPPAHSLPFLRDPRAGASAAIKVTSARGSSKPFQDSGVTLPLNPACAAAACAGAATAAKPAAVPAAAKPATAAAAVAPKAPAAAAAAVPAAAAAAAMPAAAAAAPAAATKAAATVPGCTPSPLGYSCVATTRQGTKVHYTLGGAAPPDNACTRGTKGDVAIAGGAAPQMMHFAYEGGQPVGGGGGPGEAPKICRSRSPRSRGAARPPPCRALPPRPVVTPLYRPPSSTHLHRPRPQGYAALGFTEKAGTMFPSDVVLGYIADDGTPNVRHRRRRRAGAAARGTRVARRRGRRGSRRRGARDPRRPVLASSDLALPPPPSRPPR
jgi:hypothetical protein